MFQACGHRDHHVAFCPHDNSSEVVLRTFLLAIEEANTFIGSNLSGRLTALQHKYKVKTHAGGCLNTHGNPALSNNMCKSMAVLKSESDA